MAELPTTVTFLFTDIEGSTALWERDRRRWPAVDRHFSLLRQAIESHGGVLFKTVGDAAQAAFSSAPHAVAVALDAQRSLKAEDWSSIGGLRVRMALHAGEAQPDPTGDYHAPLLNRLSRLLAAGHGGQVLLSQAVQQLARGAIPEGAELVDLGDHRLRDLLEPERVFQLRYPDLPDAFPPLRTLDQQPNNLPLQPTPFLGRVQQVTDISTLLQRPDVRFLTLTGPGGTGKTRLALQAAADLLDDFCDGVFFVPLAMTISPRLLSNRDRPWHSGGRRAAPSERLRDSLSSKDLLLVLDNFEHLADAAPAVAELLGTSPG